MVFRSERLRRLVASLPCMNCGKEGYTQAAHANMACFGKGMGIKASDAAVMALCVDCHRELDQGKSMNKDQRRQMQYECITKTHVTLIEMGIIGIVKNV